MNRPAVMREWAGGKTAWRFANAEIDTPWGKACQQIKILGDFVGL